MTLNRRLSVVPVMAFLLLEAVASLSAAAPRWRDLGPQERGLRGATAFAFDPARPDRVWAGLSGGGIARSGDGGQTWQPMSVGTTGEIGSIIVHPKLGRLVYALGYRLFRSLNDGRTWVPLPLQGVRAVAVDPRDPAVVWAGTPNGLFQSRDMGQTWRRIQANLPNPCDVNLLAVSPVDPQRIYLGIYGTNGSGLWTSGDGGRSWSRLRKVPYRVYTDLHAAQTVYILEEHRIQRSRDAGQTWEVFFDSSSANLEALYPVTMAADPREAATFFVSVLSDRRAVYRTTDGGRHWRRLTGGLPPSLETRVITVGSDGTVLLGGTRGQFTSLVFRSPDAGESWEEVSRGLVFTAVNAVAVTGSGGLFVMVYGHGVDRSLDGGATWTTSLPLGEYLTFLTRDPHDPETLYAGTRSPYGTHPRILWKTVDGGASWESLPYPFPPSEQPIQLAAMDLAVDAADPQTLYLATELDNAGSTADAGLFRSRDGGQTWEKVLAGSFLGVAARAGVPGAVLALAYSGIYRSTDHGDTWAQVLGRGDSYMKYLGISPADANVVYAVREDGLLFRSDDGGATFTSLGERLPGAGPRTIALDPLDPDTLVFVGKKGAVVRLTLGQGREVLGEELFSSYIQVLSFDPNDPLRLLAGTAYTGVLEYRFEAPPAPPAQ